MTPLPDFSAFFRALWGYDPFPRQEMLAVRAAPRRWPWASDLPTASGTTACIDKDFPCAFADGTGGRIVSGVKPNGALTGQYVSAQILLVIAAASSTSSRSTDRDRCRNREGPRLHE